MEASHVYILELNKGCNLKTSLYRIPKGSTLELRTGASLFGHEISIYTEVPEPKKEFERGAYRELKWESRGKDGAKFTTRIFLDLPGSFRYYFTIDGSNTSNGSGYILVEPQLRVCDEVLELDGIQCVTFLSKCLGPLPSWTDKISFAKETGYNMVHFTPIQELGRSKSAYCLQDQLKINPNFGINGNPPTVEQVKKITDMMRDEWKMLSICDIVLNHTANESPWLLDHPECAYNLSNSPHLKPAYLLDLILHNLSLNIAKGDMIPFGIPPSVSSEDHLNAIRHILLSQLIPEAKISEFFMVDVEPLVGEFQVLCRKGVSKQESKEFKEFKIIQDPHFRRLKSTVDLSAANEIFNIYRNDCFDEDSRQRKCAEMFKSKLDELNALVNTEIEKNLASAVENCISTIRYFRIQSDGPKIPEVSKKEPLVPRYFYEEGKGEESEMYKDETAKYIMAHNGWVMNHDPLKNFAEPGSMIYLKRELIAWGDSVKLRYGNKKEDCPYLWEHMEKYVEITASVFDGVRLDNCHSTPLPVAQFLLDAARKIKPNLYVVAELFTNSDSTDNIFVNKLGITSLIREAMSAWDSHEEGRLVYRFGGRPVGGFTEWVEKGQRMVGSVAHALFLDLTHDNPSPVEKRSVFDLFPSAALVSMAACGSGSTMGYDQLVPHHIHVVQEERQYMGLSASPLENGIARGKLALNKLHSWLSKNHFDQVFVDQIDKDIVCVTRHNETILESVILFAYTSFNWPDPNTSGAGKGITVSGIVNKIIFEAFLTHGSRDRFSTPKQYKKDEKIISGLSEYKLVIQEDFSIGDAKMVQVNECDGGNIRIALTENFRPGSVVVLRLSAEQKSQRAVEKLIKGVGSAIEAVKGLNLSDLNYALYRCSQEEESDGGGTYDIPGFGPFVYCGLQGIMSLLDGIALLDDLGHPLCTNIRNGSWLSDYTVARLIKKTGTKLLGEALGDVLILLEDLPPPMRPCYFHCIISQVHAALLNQTKSILGNFVSSGSELVHLLACGSVQCGGNVGSAILPPLSPDMKPPSPPYMESLTLAAGLPHFAVGYMRSWGRDTFIALRGLFLITGRFEEARYMILGYGGCLRHGLIPNLLDGGKNPRYNCRDAFWWWLHTIKSYTELAPNGHEILTDKVNRIFPTDDSASTNIDQTLSDTILEALSVHFQGLCFRERNAGKQIDEHMTSYGFDNQIGVHPVTGFVFGGNDWNCGTWMDKMGSSEAAGTKGKPATPRDGTAVEIVALAKEAVSWLQSLCSQGKFPYPGVMRFSKDGTKTTWTWEEWSNRIQTNFEKEFWIDEKATGDHIFRRGIYKDSVGATRPWADYQLRPNFPVAMVVAPEMFNPKNAWTALEMLKEHLLGPLGIKTLDPLDWSYVGNYDNSNQSNDPKVAHGFNYHQGPEWLWPVGYYLRARLHFGCLIGIEKDVLLREARCYLSSHWAHLKSSPWKGLPELTNRDGQNCPGSCPTQAWSNATLLEVMYDLRQMDKCEMVQ